MRSAPAACSSCPVCIFVGVGIGLAVGLTRDPSTLPSALIDQPVPEFELPPLAGPRRAGLQQRRSQGRRQPGQRVRVLVRAVPGRASAAAGARARRASPIYGINYKDPAENAAGWLAELGDPYRAIGADRGWPGRDRLGRLRRAGDLRDRSRGAHPLQVRRAAAAARPRRDAAAAARAARPNEALARCLRLALPCSARAARATPRPTRTRSCKDPALEQRARGSREAAALSRLPEPVDRRFGRRPRARSAADRARAAGRRQERSGDHRLPDRALRRLRAAQAAARAGDLGPVVRPGAGARGRRGRDRRVCCAGAGGAEDAPAAPLSAEERTRLDALLRSAEAPDRP